MAREHTPHQQRIIRAWYRNLDQIRAQRLQEIVTDIYLATSAKRRERLWERVEELLEHVDAPPAEVRHVLETRDLEALAHLAGRGA